MRWWRVSVWCGVFGLLALVGCGGVTGAPDAPAGGQPGDAVTATVPVTIDHHRLIVDVDFVRPGGGVRRAAAWVDTGNQFLIVVEGLAHELGLDTSQLEGAESGGSVESM